MTGKEIVRELEKDFKEARDFLFDYVEKNREEWYRELIKQVLNSDGRIRTGANSALGVMTFDDKFRNLVDVTPIQEKFAEVAGKYNIANFSISVRRLVLNDSSKNPNIRYLDTLSPSFKCQQILFYDDPETELLFKLRLKVKNRWWFFTITKNNIKSFPASE